MSDYIGFFKIDERGTTVWKNIDEVKKYIKDLPTGKYIVKISEYTEKRSINQNKFYWKLIEIIAREIGYEVDEMHEVFKFKFLQKTLEDVNGNLIKGISSTKKLNTKEFSDYIKKIKMFAEQELSIKLPNSFE